MAISESEIIILVDDADLHASVISYLESAASPKFYLRSCTGAGFARGVTLPAGNKSYHILCLGEHNSQPFSYLTLGAFATQYNISSVIALTSAHSLREDLFPGDLAIVRRASALTYPALYESCDPYAAPPTAEHYDANPEVLEQFIDRLSPAASFLWQRSIPQVTCGYAKHPTWQGELMPWAPEQFQKLKDQGAETISSATAGVYEAQSLMPQAEIVCINQITSTPNADSIEQWKRFKHRLQLPAIRLLAGIINNGAVSAKLH